MLRFTLRSTVPVSRCNLPTCSRRGSAIPGARSTICLYSTPCSASRCRHRLAEHGVEYKQIVERAPGIAEPLREHVGRLQRETGTVERSVKRSIAGDASLY